MAGKNEKIGGLSGMVAGAIAGATWGTGAGIATGGTAIPATVPAGIVRSHRRIARDESRVPRPAANRTPRAHGTSGRLA